MLGPAGLTSPAVLGELSRRLPSDWDVQKTFPLRKGLVGNSRMWLFPTRCYACVPQPGCGKLTGLRKISKTSPFLVTTATALRSLASTHMFSSRSRAIPSPPLKNGMSDEDVAQT